METSVIIGSTKYPAESAITNLQHQRGLMNRKDPPLMVFLFDKVAERSFWMKSTPHPLFICFCREGVVQQVSLALPNDLQHITGVADVVVEVPLGKGKVKVGDAVRTVLSIKDAGTWIDRYLLGA